MQKKLPKLQKVKTVAYFHYLIKLQKHNCKDIDALLINELQSFLLIHEQKINPQEKEEQVLKVSTKNHSTWRGGKGRGRGRGSNNCGN